MNAQHRAEHMDPARSDVYYPDVAAMPDRQAEYETYNIYGQCFLCKRDCDETSVRVQYAAGVETVCAICWERGNEGIELPLDMTDG